VRAGPSDASGHGGGEPACWAKGDVPRSNRSGTTSTTESSLSARSPVEQVGSRHQRGQVRARPLVGARGPEVGARRDDVHGPVRRGVHAVHEHQGTHARGRRPRRPAGRVVSHDVRRGRQRHQPGPRPSRVGDAGRGQVERLEVGVGPPHRSRPDAAPPAPRGARWPRGPAGSPRSRHPRPRCPQGLGEAVGEGGRARSRGRPPAATGRRRDRPRRHGRRGQRVRPLRGREGPPWLPIPRRRPRTRPR
jgi:hypothetical protein